MNDVKFNIGDRAVINNQFDPLVPNRDELVGATGVVIDVVRHAPELLFFKADDPSVVGPGEGGRWAVVDYELDKL